MIDCECTSQKTGIFPKTFFFFFWRGSIKFWCQKSIRLSSTNLESGVNWKWPSNWEKHPSITATLKSIRCKRCICTTPTAPKSWISQPLPAAGVLSKRTLLEYAIFELNLNVDLTRRAWIYFSLTNRQCFCGSGLKMKRKMAIRKLHYPLSKIILVAHFFRDKSVLNDGFSKKITEVVTWANAFKVLLLSAEYSSTRLKSFSRKPLPGAIDKKWWSGLLAPLEREKESPLTNGREKPSRKITSPLISVLKEEIARRGGGYKNPCSRKNTKR